MRQSSFSKIIIAGFVSTAVMTMMLLIAPMMGMPEMNIGRMLGGFMGVPVFLGWVSHFVIGFMLAVIYITVLAHRLPGSPWLKGLLFSLIPWFVAQVLVNPLMGVGVFAINTPSPLAMVMGSLMGHLVYGVVLGAIDGKQRRPFLEEVHV